MKGRLGAALIAILATIVLSRVGPQAQQLPPQSARFVTGEVLLKFRPGISEFQRSGILNGRGARSIHRFGGLGVERVQLRAGEDVVAAVAAFRRAPGVALAQPNFIRRLAASAPPDDPYWLFGLLWGLERIQAQSVWSTFTNGSADVVVAGLDTGVDYTHPDLAPNMWRNPGEIPQNAIDDDGNGYVDDVFGIDSVNHDSDPMDDQGHGTHTAGTIAAAGNNGEGVVGVAWGSKILACKFVTSTGTGTDAGAIECFDYILALKQRGINIRVTSNSWGGFRDGSPAEVLKAAIDAVGDAGILNVFAAGNDGADTDAMPFDPAGFDSPSIVSVAASDQADNRASFSNYGARSVDLAAPGDFILSTYAQSYAFASGTSMAAPHVAGAAALLASRDPNLSVDAIKTLLMHSVDLLPQWAGLTVSGGRLNVLTAATFVGGNIPPSVTVMNPASGSAYGVSTPVTLEARATDVDGSVTQVDFLVNDTPVGTDTTATNGVFAVTWTGSVAGRYTVRAVATDDGGATRASTPVSVTLTPPPGRMNVALASTGAVAVASSEYSSAYPATGVNNGDRKGVGWGSGGGWNDGTSNVWPDWLEVRFNGPQTIEEIDVFMVQDNVTAPSEPTETMTFTKWGVRDFAVEYWTGSAWEPVPGGTVTNKSLVWHTFNFVPLTASRIRVFITNGVASSSRLVEVEAYAVLGRENRGPSVTLTNPAGAVSVPVNTAVTLTANAIDVDGTIARVEFYANNELIGTDASGVGETYGVTWTPSIAGTYTVTAVAADDGGAIGTSSAVAVTILPPPGRMNVALANTGAVAVASSEYSSAYPASGVNNGDRKGMGWGSGGGWVDGTANVWPDWLEVRFNGAQTIEEIDVFMVQDNVTAPSEPTPSMTFTKWGARDFVVEYWTGSGWQQVPGGSVTNNSLVWRAFNFAPLSTTRIRVLITNGLASSSRLVEVEAYAAPGSENRVPDISITSPAAGASLSVNAAATLEATATDVDGGVSRVEFYANDQLVGTDMSSAGGIFSVTWTPTSLGSYRLIAIAADEDGATHPSSPVTITVMPPPGRMNVARASTGAVAVASSEYSSGYPATGVNNGDRKGVGWGSGGGWVDGTLNVWPDWLEVRFNGPQMIEEIDVFMVQDNVTAPSEPTPTMTFTRWGVRDFVVEYWTGSAWQQVPGGSVTSNTFVWRTFNFAPVTTSRIRVFIMSGVASSSRLVEVEAYAVLGSENHGPNVTLTNPAAPFAVDVGSPVTIDATAMDPEGTVSRVDFYANSELVGTDSVGGSGAYRAAWTPAVAGKYTVKAVATDELGAIGTSNAITVTVLPPPGRMNVALANTGAVAVASSEYSGAYPASGVNNGDRKGVGWGSGGGWNDGTSNVWPDWLEVRFNGPQTIEEIDVFMVQDNVTAPSEPTEAMTFTKWGVRDFIVEYWTGSAWQPVPGGTVINNSLVWRTFNFVPVTTSRIRVFITNGVASSSRLVEVEAYAALGGENRGPGVMLISPAAATTVAVNTAVTLAATATDAEGTVSRVDFYANGQLVGSDADGVGGAFDVTWTPALAGSYSVTAVAADDRGATGTSTATAVTVLPPPGRINVALASTGAVAVASSEYSSAYPASGVNNGDRKGLGWGSGGGWVDGTLNVWPDWLEVRFNGPQTIEEIDIFMVQDNVAAPSEPTPSMTFTKWGARDFVVEYWTGSAWQQVPGGSVINNSLVWRAFNFAPLSTTRIRVLITKGLASSSRLVEVEAYAPQ
jgi:subtilisin family serine protease